MNILFLDVDGVLTSARTGWMNWDIYAVNYLRYICRNANIKIVISSTWRHNRNRQFFVDIFGEELIHEDWRTICDLNDFTLNCRGDEIQNWLDNHPETTKYMILDDDSDMLEHQKQFLFLTDSYNGIIYKDKEKIGNFWGIPITNMNLVELHQHPNMFQKFNSDLQSKTRNIKFT